MARLRNDPADDAFILLSFGLSFCVTEKHLEEWHGHEKNKRVFDLLTENHKERLREKYRAKLKEVKGR